VSQDEERKVIISVVTATFNAAGDLPNLVASLRHQTDKDFEWVVADGLSTDGTTAILRAAGDLRIRILERADFGIYDALNEAIRASAGEFYIVAGADDVFEADAIERYRAAAGADVDIVTAKVRYKGECVGPRGARPWLIGTWAFVSFHAVGCMIRKELHERHGYYSRHYPLAADQLFLKQAYQGGARIRVLESVAGEFGSGGVSTLNTLAQLTDTFRVQYLTERNKWLQIGLFFLRVLKNKLQSRI
jgi:glycosyltransferase involved in cell wall biosynthesis